MGIFSMMRTSISGMNAQSSRMSAVADNVANSSSIGYKRASVQFSDLLSNEGFSSYQSGSILGRVRYDVSVEGGARVTSSAEDLRIQGSGFFLVTDRVDGSGTVVLTRAGDFRPDKDGNLRNSAGFYLLSRDDNKSIVNIGKKTDVLQKAEATHKVDFSGTLPYNSPVHEESKFDPQDEKTYNFKSSTTVIGNHGQTITLPVYYIKVKEDSKEKWKVFVPSYIEEGKPLTQDNFKGVDGKGSLSAKLIDFDDAGNLKKDVLAGSVIILEKGKSIDDLRKNPTGDQSQKIDIHMQAGNLISRGSSFSMTPEADGRLDGAFKSYTLDSSGNVIITLTNGNKINKGQIQLATVADPFGLLSSSGTVFVRTRESGDTVTGEPGSGIFGSIANQQLEQSNADIASELTDMIEAQRSYSSNTKVFQTGSEMMDALLNMVR